MKYWLTFKSTRHETADSLADPEREKEAVPERRKGAEFVNFIGLIKKVKLRHILKRNNDSERNPRHIYCIFLFASRHIYCMKYLFKEYLNILLYIFKLWRIRESIIEKNIGNYFFSILLFNLWNVVVHFKYVQVHLLQKSTNNHRSQSELRILFSDLLFWIGWPYRKPLRCETSIVHSRKTFERGLHIKFTL